MINFLFKKILSSATSKIILANIIVFVLMIIANLIFGGQKIIELFALTPSMIVSGKNLWTLITSMFMHGGIFHLLFNMLSLAFVGLFVEKIIGKKRFVWFYLIAGLFAGVFFALSAGLLGGSDIGGKLFGVPDISGVGASGAIFGLIGLIAVLTPKNRVYLIAGPLIAIILSSVVESVTSNEALITGVMIAANIYILLSIFFMFSFNPKKRMIALPLEMPFWILPIVAIVPLVIIGFFVSLPIGNAAHFGGLLIGLAYGFYLKKKYPRKTAMIARYFSKK